jgi:hypothetical protein
MLACNRVCIKKSSVCRISKSRVAVLKVVPVAPVNFLPAWIGQFFIVTQQMDAPWAQEKKRFEEIHRST